VGGEERGVMANLKRNCVRVASGFLLFRSEELRGRWKAKAQPSVQRDELDELLASEMLGPESTGGLQGGVTATRN
jgi:hypothetical protein